MDLSINEMILYYIHHLLYFVVFFGIIWVDGENKAIQSKKKGRGKSYDEWSDKENISENAEAGKGPLNSID